MLQCATLCCTMIARGKTLDPSVTRRTRWRTSRVAWWAARSPGSIIRQWDGRRNAEKNAVPPADGPWHAPGWPIACMTA